MRSKVVKLIALIANIIIFSLFLSCSVFAAEESFATIVNPVRGPDFWGLENQDPLMAVREQMKTINENDLPASWLLRFDLINDEEMVTYFKNIPPNQELGIFLEVTPAWTNEAGAEYHQSAIWHWANSVFLSGYNVEERKKLIDTAFLKFKETFGYFPKSVGAWHLDATSLNYMQKQYKITGALICADQFLTDKYQIWGGWWGVPYYPSRYNVLVPAQTKKNKLNLVVFQWAARDPIMGYGGGVFESTYSVQANDYLDHNLDTTYFSRLVDTYVHPKEGKFGQITVGLENDFVWGKIGKEYENQIVALTEKKLKFLTMAEFSHWYQEQFPALSPSHQIEGEDYLDSNRKAIWLMSTNGRVGLLEEEGKTFIRDWRLYHEEWAESYLETANTDQMLRLNLPAKIDSVRLPSQSRELTEEPSSLISKRLRLPFTTSRLIYFLVVVVFVAFEWYIFRLNKKLWFLITAGAVIQFLTMVRSGLLLPFGMGFWGPHGHDGVWHLALINQVLKGFPPPHPTLAGFKLTNYHYFYDLVLAIVNKLTTIPIHHLYFQIFPIFLAFGIGILSFLVGYYWKKDFWIGFWLAFFNYFAGSFGFLVTLWRTKELGGESLFWSMQSISTLINPSFALSLVILLAGILLLLRIKKWNKWKIIGLGLLFGILINIKVYAGIIALPALFVFALFKKKRQYLIIFLIALITSLATFFIINRQATSLLVLEPFWFIHTMIESQDRFYWPRLATARHAFVGNKAVFKLFLVELVGLGIFLIGNLGTRIIGLITLIEKNIKKDFDELDAFIFIGGAVGLLMPLLFIQKGTAWNTIQFFYYFLFFANFYAAVALAKLMKLKSNYKLVLIGVIILLTLPTSWATFRGYLGWPPPTALSMAELEALEWLKEQKEATVLTFFYNPFEKERFPQTPIPLYAYETTAYVSAFSGKQTFLEDEMNLRISDYDFKQRAEDELKFFITDDEIWARGFLLNNQIGYIYLTDRQRFLLSEEELGIEKIFDNGEVRIYQVRGII